MAAGVSRSRSSTGLPVADETLALIERRSARYALTDFLPTPQHRERSFVLLTPRPGLYDRLSEMHDCGLLGRMFPEFHAFSCRVVRDFYHKYTVDEHTLLTIRDVECCSTPRRRPRTLRVDSQELHAPELLMLALLFHDVGKWREEDHARKASRWRKRCSIGSTARRTSARRRRVPDPRITCRCRRSPSAATPKIRKWPREFAEFVGTEENLKMLCLLTFADVGAVSPGYADAWKEELLWRLYVDTYNALTHGLRRRADRGDAGRRAALVAGRPADISDGELAAFLEGLPQPLPVDVRPRTSTGTFGWRATSSRTRSTAPREAATTSGS